MRRREVYYLIFLILNFMPPVFGQWSAKQIADNTYNSVLRSMSQGVYDHYSDKSFFCFMQGNSDPYVAECDHSNGEHIWSEPYKVYTQTNASKYNYPTIDILPDRRVVLTYASPFDRALGFAITNSSADASSWSTQVIDIKPLRHVEYPRIKVDRQGNIFLFFVSMESGNAAHKRWYYYVKSEDNGNSWSVPELAIQRELDDSYGMCEIYVGYTAEEPYRVGEPERWWFAYTSSSGFQHEGVHTGPDNSRTLIDTNGVWSISNIRNRWLYNTTKRTNSDIDSANEITLYPTDEMDWDNGDKYGIAYHNIYHSDIFVNYFCPDNGHWYNAAHNDLGTVISRNEMETEAGRPYISPIPPASKDVGYVPIVTVNDKGVPNILDYIWNGTRWENVEPQLLSSDIRFYYFTDDNYYIASGRFNVFNSSSVLSWKNIGNTSLPNSNNFATYGVFVNEGHAEALFNVHEYNANAPGNAYGISIGENYSPEALILRTPTPKLNAGDTGTVYAFVTDKVHGSRSRIRSATNTINLEVVNGSANIEISTAEAVNGMASFRIIPASTSGEILTFKASSPDLENYYIDVLVNGGTPIIKNLFNMVDSKVVQVHSDENVIIEYSVYRNEFVSIEIYDLLGKKVTTLEEGYKNSGQYKVQFNAKGFNLANCVYIAKVALGNKIITRRFHLL